ncbi:TrkH family potassium uptake protein [Flavobacteriaceae bacterium]|jgi:trk system potassium uptake protein TrkH|nr:TrkH family potassium uptake protein [Flavobacteriaceae bacterium]MDA8559172.1 TrkH family potassium uptake protein [Flavobacteriaceae bacterium]MDA8587492.1 TrkH family potassium uptake protein [Flavobacteriaceae bacterium]MDA8641430.1 TrkH family potassium uptake protein [Flavobacteriaceae bacterium]MDC0355353.1 TrkH family potassium uptake protein [Flavobacteriaceae bacterium]|tara:strand:+ start:1455 stop:2948 length:1494 start_codon:yes stop_codon:yes gene_type:complete
MSKLNRKLIFHILGLLLMFNGFAMLISAFVSYLTNDGVLNEMTIVSLLVIFFGWLFMTVSKKNERKINKRDAYFVVVLGWLVMIFSGMLPYVVTDSISSFSNIFFETMSGYTTTGSTIINDIDALPKSIIFWRSMTHWLGGMGIIVLAIAILPLLGIGGMQLFTAEAPGLTGDKIHPRISDTAKRLWLIYVGLTFLETILLTFAGMSFFDAINNSMSNIASGGFSSKNESIGFWNDNPLIQYIVIFFMFLAGTNFILIYFGLTGKFKKIFQDTEFKWYVSFICAFVFISTLILFFQVNLSSTEVYHPEVLGKFESSFRHSLFQVVAIVTTTGFVTGDFISWTPFLTMLFFGIMFLGGSSGSTSGGVKVLRHLILIKNGFLEFKRSLHPNAIFPLRHNNHVVEKPIIIHVLAFFILYLILFIIGAGVLSALGLDFVSAIGGAASSLGNVGPALGTLGPISNFDSLPEIGKYWCAFLMLVGRLELFTVLIFFTPYFWKS